MSSDLSKSIRDLNKLLSDYDMSDASIDWENSNWDGINKQWEAPPLPDKRKILRKILDDYDIEMIEEYVRSKKLERISSNIKRKGDR